MKTIKMYRLISASGCYTDFTDYQLAEKELQNLVDNGHAGLIREINKPTF